MPSSLASLKFKFDAKAKIPSLILGIFALSLINISVIVPKVKTAEVRRLIAPPPHLEHHSVGFKEAFANMLWIRAIQDFDYCEQEVAQRVCRNDSWLYKMLDKVTTLSPHFRMPYAVGGLALTIIITDIDGATKFFEKGVKAFPNDWPIIYRAAYHQLYEVKNKTRAAELLILAGKNGAPPWVFSLAGRLYSDVGERELAERLLAEMKATNQDQTIIRRLEDKLSDLKSQSNTKSNKASQ